MAAILEHQMEKDHHKVIVKGQIKSQDFDRLVEEIDKKMVTGYGNASLNSADLRQAISEAVYNPSQVQEVKYIAEDGEVFIDNMMVVVFLDVMNHLAPEGSIYAKTAGFFDLLKKMPRYANDIATARRELFKDGDYSAEQIRQTLLDETPLKIGQTLMYRRVSDTLLNLTSEELDLKTDPQSKLDFLLLLNQIKTILIELKLENPFDKEKYADISELHDEVCDYVYSELIQSHEKDIISEWLDKYDELESELNKIHRRQRRANSRDRSMTRVLKVKRKEKK